jgi:hypothetical protein
MKNHFYFLLPMLLLLVSCGIEEHEPYQTSFVHIMLNEAPVDNITSNSNFVRTYSVFLSSAPLNKTLEVYYEIQVGNGLKEGRDFELLTQSRTLVFPTGVYDMPIRIRWMPNPIDVTKDNTLKIVLTGTNLGITVGLPGPDHLQQVFTITKTKG